MDNMATDTGRDISEYKCGNFNLVENAVREDPAAESQMSRQGRAGLPPTIISTMFGPSHLDKKDIFLMLSVQDGYPRPGYCV